MFIWVWLGRCFSRSKEDTQLHISARQKAFKECKVLPSCPLNLKNLKQVTGESSDVVFRTFKTGSRVDSLLFHLDGMVDSRTIEAIFRSLMMITSAKVEGAALFQDDRMVTWASGEEIRGWMFLRNRIFRSTIVIPSPEDNEDLLSIEVYRSQTHLTRFLNEGVAQVIRWDLERIIHRAQEERIDVLGFGNLFYRKKPHLWAQVQEDWEEILSSLPVDIGVQVYLERVGLVKSPLVIE